MKKSILFVIFILSITLCSCFSPVEEIVWEDEAVPAAVYSETESAVSEIQETAAELPEEPEPAPDPAEEFLSGMSPEEKIGQVILARCLGDPAEKAGEYHFGGYTFYADDFENETPESFSEKLSEIDSANGIPMFFAADEEGGKVVRISCYPQFAERQLPSVQKMLSEGGDISAWVNEMTDNLQRAGVNLNLAPVADVAESRSDYIYSRTCGLGYEETGEVISEIIAGLNSRKIVSCLKHFPGYGSNVDTHTGIAVDKRTSESFETGDFIPFIYGIEAGSPMIMVNHNIIEAYDPEVPASLSPEVHRVLRELGFDGIIVSDDLGMDAISLYTSEPYSAAFLAGNDLLCVSDGAACYNALYEAFQNGEITEERLDESVLRIIRVKWEYGIIP